MLPSPTRAEPNLAGRVANRKFRYAWCEAVISKDEPSGLSPTQRLVALAFDQHVNSTTLTGFPGPTTLARRTGLSLSAVKAALKALVRAGWLEQVKQGGSHPGNRETSVYRLTRPSPVPVHDNTRSAGEPVQDVARPVQDVTSTRAGDGHRPSPNPVNDPGEADEAQTRPITTRDADGYEWVEQVPA